VSEKSINGTVSIVWHLGIWVQGGQERAQGTRRAKTAEFVRTSLVRAADLAFGLESTVHDVGQANLLEFRRDEQTCIVSRDRLCMSKIV
jgi:hypothetical protein